MEQPRHSSCSLHGLLTSLMFILVATMTASENIPCQGLKIFLPGCSLLDSQLFSEQDSFLQHQAPSPSDFPLPPSSPSIPLPSPPSFPPPFPPPIPPPFPPPFPPSFPLPFPPSFPPPFPPFIPPTEEPPLPSPSPSIPLLNAVVPGQEAAAMPQAVQLPLQFVQDRQPILQLGEADIPPVAQIKDTLVTVQSQARPRRSLSLPKRTLSPIIVGKQNGESSKLNKSQKVVKNSDQQEDTVVSLLLNELMEPELS